MTKETVLGALQGHVEVDPSGYPVLANTQFPLSRLLSELADGHTVDHLAEEHDLVKDVLVDALHALASFFDRPATSPYPTCLRCGNVLKTCLVRADKAKLFGQVNGILDRLNSLFGKDGWRDFVYCFACTTIHLKHPVLGETYSALES